MAYQGKTYTLENQEKFDEFLVALGVPQDRIDAICKEKTTLRLSKDGDTFTQVSRNQTLSFKSGEEFKETIDGRECNTTFIVVGDTLTQTQMFPDGKSVTFKKEFSPDKAVVTATNSEWDGVAYRYYSA